MMETSDSWYGTYNCKMGLWVSGESISPTNRNSRNSRWTVPGRYMRGATGASKSDLVKVPEQTEQPGQILDNQRHTSLPELLRLSVTAISIRLGRLRDPCHLTLL